MHKRLNQFFITCMIVLPFLTVTQSHAKPPKPGPNFIWIKSHTTPSGHFVSGHWKYAGSSKKEKVWIPGHHDPDGKWIPGQWKSLCPSKKDSVWVPSHHDPKGRFIPGHWR